MRKQLCPEGMRLNDANEICSSFAVVPMEKREIKAVCCVAALQAALLALCLNESPKCGAFNVKCFALLGHPRSAPAQDDGGGGLWELRE